MFVDAFGLPDHLSADKADEALTFAQDLSSVPPEPPAPVAAPVEQASLDDAPFDQTGDPL